MSPATALRENTDAKLRLLMRSWKGREERNLLSLYAGANLSLHSGSRGTLHDVAVARTTIPKKPANPSAHPAEVVCDTRCCE